MKKAINGVLCINKPQEMTSHDLVNIVRKALGTKKVGHTGTLDPMATGVMGILIGRSTKLSQYITGSKKEYTAGIRFGLDSASYDIWTELTEVYVPQFSEEDLRKVLASFKGECIQTPPVYSAIKVDGKPLYKYAREGKEVEIPKRKVFIDSVELMESRIPDSVKIRVVCSKGTYIRSLVHDIGEKLGTKAVMNSLERTVNGCLTLDNSVTVEELRELAEKGGIEKYIIKDELLLEDYPRVDVHPESGRFILNGNPMYRKNLITDTDSIENGGTVRIYLEGKFLGMGRKTDEDGIVIRPSRIIYSN